MAVSLTLRSAKGSALTHDEMDANWTALKTAVDALQDAGDAWSTGDIRASLTATPGTGWLELDGSTVSRTTYADLWTWVQAQNLNAGAGGSEAFGNGDGSTTFVLPDCRGRVLRSVKAAEDVGDFIGGDSIDWEHTHTHSLTVDSHTHGLTPTDAELTGTGSNVVTGTDTAAAAPGISGTIDDAGSSSESIIPSSVLVKMYIKT